MTTSEEALAEARFLTVADVIRSRRTTLLLDRDESVPDTLVETLCELARWAPCHKRTWPWVFASLTGDARRRLGDAAADALAANGEDDGRVAKTRMKYLRAPTMLIVGARHGDEKIRTIENRDAVCAAVENLLLAATAAGLGSYWSSCPAGAERAVAEVAGFGEAVSVIAVVYLGWPIRDCPPPERPPVDLVHVS